MPRFFIKQEQIANNNTVTLSGDDAIHISRSLRMRCGDNIVLCDYSNFEYDCEIIKMTSDSVQVSILEKRVCASEPDIRVTLYQAIPKGQKFELIIQKCVELGVFEIVPVITSRCVSRPDEGSFEKKTKRWNSISEEASKQSGRGSVPRISPPQNFEQAIKQMTDSDVAFMCYEEFENREQSSDIKAFLKETLSQNKKQISFFIGPEGGISPEEADLAIQSGISCVGLGKRILRTETAPICVLSCIMYESENLK